MMNKLNYTYVTDVNNPYSIMENENFLFIRQSNALIFYSKKDKGDITEFEIVIDNEFGYKRIEAFNDIVFTAVYPKKDEESPLFGTNDFVELRAYSREKILWKRVLKGWTTSSNYGGFHIVGEVLFLFEKRKHTNTLTILEPTTGEELFTDNFIELNHKESNPSIGQKSLVYNNNIYAVSGKNLLKIYFNNEKNILVSNELANNIKMITISGSTMAMLSFDDKYKILVYELHKEQLIKETELEIEFEIDSILLNKSSSQLIITGSLNDNYILCLDMISGKKLWEITLKEFSEPINHYIDSNDLLHVYLSDFINMKSVLEIINMNDGKKLFSTITSEELINHPIFYCQGKLFTELDCKLFQYEYKDDIQ